MATLGCPWIRPEINAITGAGCIGVGFLWCVVVLDEGTKRHRTVLLVVDIGATDKHVWAVVAGDPSLDWKVMEFVEALLSFPFGQTLLPQ